MTDDPITAAAEATREVAKATGKAIDAGAGLGRFLARIFGPALEEFGGSLQDQTRFWRKTRLLRLESRYEEFCKEMGDQRKEIVVEPKFAIALLDAASLESDDYLQDFYARLLANVTAKQTGIESRRAFISILQDLTSLDAHLLSMIYKAPKNDRDTTAILWTSHFRGLSRMGPLIGDNLVPTPREVERSLLNLERLGCISAVSRAGRIQEAGTDKVDLVAITELGRALIDACTLEGTKDQTGEYGSISVDVIANPDERTYQ